MYAKVTTTITSEIDLDTFEINHSVQIGCDDELPKQVILAAVVGACNSTVNTIGDPLEGGLLVEEVEDE